MEPDFKKTDIAPVDPADAEKNKVVSALAYVWILFFLPLVVCPTSPFGRFHANQGLVLFLVSTVGTLVLRLIPGIGGVLASIFGLIMLIFMIMGIVNAVKGTTKELPVIGSIKLIR